MNREEALDYIEIASKERIKERCKYCLEEDYEIDSIKSDIEYYENVVKYIRENLK